MIILLLIFRENPHAQDVAIADVDITGLWKGTIYNDSTQQFYKYEIGISENKGKFSGFSHTWYNDKDYFVVKELKVKKTDGKIIITDVDIIAYNYPESPPKGVRRLHVLTLQVQDSILILSGIFTTNRTKQYSPATGTVTLQRKNDYRRHSDLMAHLQELGLDKLSFFKKDVDVTQDDEEKSLTRSQSSISKIDIKKDISKTQTVKAPNQKVAIQPIVKNKNLSVASISPKPAADVSVRKTILQETMFFKTDSLELSLYDNGEVDGDTVSVLVNGNIIMAKQRLSTKAIRQTINIRADLDSIELVMYAENLGTLPPNSGLLVVRDGKDIYEIRFSGDLQKNASVIFKRRKN
ncbi:MAG: hypothetical protein WKI04_11990 [Ferruginibacter sp.]